MSQKREGIYPSPPGIAGRRLERDRSGDRPDDPDELAPGAPPRAIAQGEAQPGERLPPARDLAVLGVNRNTILRALRQLREEGLLDFRRGRGVTVSGTPQQGAIQERARELVELARRHGYRREELIELIEALP